MIRDIIRGKLMKMDTQPLSCRIVQLDNPTEDQKPEAGIFLLIFFSSYLLS